MHTMIKRALFFLACAILTEAIGLSNIAPAISQTAEGLCLLSVVLVMFFAVAYSLRGEDYKT